MNAEKVIRDFGLSLAAEDLESIIEGVVAAPTGEYPDRWMDGVASVRSEALTGALRRQVELKVAETKKGLGQAPAPVARLHALQTRLRELDVHGFVIPRGDEFHNEYPPRRADRLEWLTGFSGSAGAAVVLLDRAAIFVDGRYTLQASQEVDATHFETRHLLKEPPGSWLREALPEGGRLAVDPWLHAGYEVDALADAVRARNGELVFVDGNPIDDVWVSQPRAPYAPLRIHPLEHAGRSPEEKLEQLRETLAAEGASGVVLTATDSVAWLTNLRGGDLPHTPAFLAYLVVSTKQATLFVDERKCSDAVLAHLGDIRVESLEAFVPRLSELAGRVMVDPKGSPYAVTRALEGAGCVVLSKPDPVALPKAMKNDAELAGARAAHRRDGAAVARFLFWLQREVSERALGEIEAAERLLAFRRENDGFEDLSFETISGAGANGAIIHYRVTRESERLLDRGTLYLVDSGAQYRDGTTDITRTVAIGEVGAEERDRFTRVLKGHIAVARAVFPKGTAGIQIDALARQALWEVGLNYDHGTGHGVGSYLSVHEGPQSLSPRPNFTALEPGMICSNEPGYYKAGAYGIRIENLVIVGPAPDMAEAEEEMLAFETLTLAPIDRTLIEPALLTAAELRWLNAYHARVNEALTPMVDPDTARWLREVTAPIAG